MNAPFFLGMLIGSHLHQAAVNESEIEPPSPQSSARSRKRAGAGAPLNTIPSITQCSRRFQLTSTLLTGLTGAELPPLSTAIGCSLSLMADINLECKTGDPISAPVISEINGWEGKPVFQGEHLGGRQKAGTQNKAVQKLNELESGVYKALAVMKGQARRGAGKAKLRSGALLSSQEAESAPRGQETRLGSPPLHLRAGT